MLFKKSDKSLKAISIDQELIENSIFAYSIHRGLLWAENKKELLLDGKANSWSPESLRQLHLNEFPLIEDFRIELNATFFPEGEFGPSERTFVDFVSLQHGILLRTLFLETFVSSRSSIPTGTLEKPHVDGDEGYFLIIFQHEKLVYFLRGNWDENANLYHTWFKVPAETYAEAWLHIKQWYEVRTKKGVEFYRG